MKQLTQKLKQGEMDVRDVPAPAMGPGDVLVANHYSLISAGTEASTVKAARQSLIGKARARPQQAKQVLEVLRAQGPVQTYRAVMKKLDAYSPLGYSTSGEVIGVGENVQGLRVGDRVACAGATANHAAVVSVPQNLVVKLAPDADMQQASYNALGSIAMQGVRRAQNTLGETCAVIGLGLIGQLTGLMLRAAGVRTLGIDVDASAVKLANELAYDGAWTRDTAGLVDLIMEATDGLGVDSVIITAGTSSLDPINFAGEIARKRGRVVVVGAVPTGFDRDPHYYRKELDLLMSCSYGPGRYDPNFEDKGMDYPAAYVRWTERRNMASFQRLIEDGRIDVAPLTTHVFPLEKASDAYDLVLKRHEPYLGVLLAYDPSQQEDARPARIEIAPSKPVTGKLGISFIGAGSYAQGFLLPNLPTDGSVAPRGVATNSGTTSTRVAEKFGFSFAAEHTSAIFEDDDTDVVFIATRHDSHGPMVLDALEAGKHAYVEKPLCLTGDELIAIEEAHQKQGKCRVMVGFNRRYAPLAVGLKTALSSAPITMTYRVNAGSIPADSWIQDPEIGGGRIIGEVCHFIDFATFMAGSRPVLVHASAVDDAKALEDTVSINLEFENGSVASIQYFANGPKGLAKERVEVLQTGRAWIIDDFREMTSFEGNNKPKREKLLSQDKGQAAMVKTFLSELTQGAEPSLPFSDIRAVTAATLGAVQSLRNRAPVRIL